MMGDAGDASFQVRFRCVKGPGDRRTESIRGGAARPAPDPGIRMCFPTSVAYL